MTFFLGLTGGIATGKTTAAKFFRKQQVTVIDADEIAHQLMEPGAVNYQKIVATFGKGVLAKDQSIDRKKLGAMVFGQKEQLSLLTKTTQPEILDKIWHEMGRLSRTGIPLVVLDLPLLFEDQIEDWFSATLLISLPKDLQEKRLMERSHLSLEAARARIASQLALSEKEHLADYVIFNTGTIKDLEQKLAILLEKIGR